MFLREQRHGVVIAIDIFVHMNNIIQTKLPLSLSWLEDGCGLVDNLQTTINTLHIATQLGSFWQRRHIWRLESTFEGLYRPNNLVFVKLESPVS